MDLDQVIKNGAKLRENNELLKALESLTRVLVVAGKKGDYRALLDALVERCLVWKHFYLQNKDEAFLVLAREDTSAMEQIADISSIKDRIHTTYYLRGSVELLFNNYGEAVKRFKLALKHFKGFSAERGDWYCHLGEALYRSGQVGSGIKTMLKGIGEIKKDRKQAGEFLTNVWLSGAYLKLADLERELKPKEAKDYLSKAAEIIKKDERLILRSLQLREVRRKFI
jgi:tetratricopeptide (TPR) repeat protein